MKRQRGFTLIEVVIATTLLAVGLALSFASIRSAGKATERAEILAQRQERLRAVQGLLRAQLNGALPIAFEFNPDTGEATFFRMSRNKLEFVATMPGYLSRGGPYLQTLELVPGARGQRLVFQHQLLSTDGPLKAEREPVVLLDGIREGGFQARSIDQNSKIAPWQADWDISAQIPPLVRLQLRFEDPARRWPEFVAAPRLAVASAIDPLAATGGR